MKKTTKIRNVLTDEMIQLIRNKELTSAQVGDILRHIIFPGEFEIADGMSKVFAESFRGDYLELCLSCAESKLKEIERLKTFYSSPKRETPAWFTNYYAQNRTYYENIINAITNIIGQGDNTEKHYGDIIKACDNVPIILHSINEGLNRNRNGNQIKSNQTKRVSKESIYPPKSPEGIDGEPPAISADDLLNEQDEGRTDAEVVAEQAAELADTIEKHAAWSHMRVNRKKLMKCLISVLKKNGAAGDEILAGLERWTEHWQADDWRYAPGRITDWLYDGKYLEEPRKKTAAAIGDVGDVGVSDIV